jgi:TRAP-type C4-dicarboxylate transport system substrate-binding protein
MGRKLLVISVTLVLILLVTSLAACSGKTATTNPATAAPVTTASAAPSTAAAPVAAGKYNLKFAAYHATGTEEAKLCEYFIDQVKTKTNGAVQIQFFPGGSLLTAPNMYDGVVNGIADIGEGGLSYNPGKFPEIDLATCPLGVQSPWIITHVINDFYQKYKPAEFKDTHILWFWENGPAVLMTAKKPVQTLDDVKGLKIRAQALTGQILSALGGAPQSVAMAEMYDGLSKGVVDGVLVDPSVLISFKLGDVIKYFTDCSKAVGNAYAFYITMNNDSWNKLPKDIQDIINQVCADIVETAAQAINREDIDGIQYAVKSGTQILGLSDAEVTRWQAAVASVTDNYIASITKDGKYNLDVQKEHLKFLQDRVAYWTDQQTQKGIPFPLQSK